ncbi:uncharacterized protein [Littorina saxatilis]|uniref:uncharacterized protein n=1 Tax=Littorina saxatilis TaxID=31220 RepID=UPI0038B5913E
MKLFCIILICSQWLPCIIGREQPQLDCPDYVPKNEGVSCLCSAPQHVLKPKIKWLHHTSTPSPFLYLYNVRRWKNNTQYTCLVTGDGYQGSTDYILRVAYGPSVEHLTVRPSTLVTNGSQKSNLTCNATHVYPAPKYQWSGIKCENTSPDNVCTFTPNPVTDDRTNVTCTAVGSYGDNKFWKHPRQTSKQLQLNLTHPPPKKPTIYLKGRDYIQQGDKLSCTVKGGQPLVDSVHFHCTNPDLRGEDEERSELSVSSSVTVTSAAVNTMMGMTCLCNASWNVRPEYYMLTSTAVYLFARVPRKLSDKALEMTNYGVSFTLEANPVPDTFRFVHLGNQLPDMETNMSDRFTSECTQKTKGSYFVTCTVTPLNISELLPGFYKVSVSNELGSVDVTINNGVQKTNYVSTTIIAGVTVALLIVVAAVIIIIAIVKKRCYQNRHGRSKQPSPTKNGFDRVLFKAPAPQPMDVL